MSENIDEDVLDWLEEKNIEIEITTTPEGKKRNALKVSHTDDEETWAISGYDNLVAEEIFII